MIPVAVMNSEKLGLPIAAGLTRMTKTTLKLNSGMKTILDNTKIINKAAVQLITNHHLRAAHIFIYKNTETNWYLFEPALSQLSPNEINGHMILAAQAIQKTAAESVFPTKSPDNHFIKDRNQVIQFLEGIDFSEAVHIVLVFSDRVFTVGNYFDENTFCRAIYNQRQPSKKFPWPKSSLVERSMRNVNSEGKPLMDDRYSQEKCYKKCEVKTIKGVKENGKKRKNNSN